MALPLRDARYGPKRSMCSSPGSRCRGGKTRLVVNPAGYEHEGERGFNPGFCVGIDEG